MEGRREREKKGREKGREKEEGRGEKRKGRIDSSLSFQDTLPRTYRPGNDLQ